MFFLAKLDSDLIEAIDLKVLADENIEIAEKYNFSHLIPPVKFYKELIEEYCMRMDPIKYASLPKYAISAKQRIQNHLSYKLGSALIENSKSILGYIRMPFVLSYIRDKHKKDQLAYESKMKKNPNLTLPPLTSYLDYKEALKEKECFTYKLGEAFIKAYKAWYKGGLIMFLFKIQKIKLKGDRI
ncbi:alpha-2,3-sialyltransferase [Campylobacter coli]|nr:alpha-2,3-sialyltransferase [Campylobacter coli]EDC4845915.1 alpha-2,3-sialyltransferase [Campylobacter coli]EDK0147044.1 alpha-2,3-sialyltransferase [Campylobacter coli]